MTLTKIQFKKEIIKYFEQNSNLTIKEAKILIQKQIKVDEFDTDITAKNVRLFYTSNPNYAGGIKRGYGKGFYITNMGLKGGSEIKL